MSRVSATYGLTQSPLVMSTAGSCVGVGIGVDVGTGVSVGMGLGEGEGVSVGAGMFAVQAEIKSTVRSVESSFGFIFYIPTTPICG